MFKRRNFKKMFQKCFYGTIFEIYYKNKNSKIELFF